MCSRAELRLILSISLSALSCGVRTSARGITSAGEFSLVDISMPLLNGIDAAEFDLRIGQWMVAQEISILQSLAIDGKCLRGSARTDGKPLQLLSAVSHRLRLTVVQQPVEEKSNEIPALEPLLRKLPRGALEGSLITADAMQCQQESSRLVTQDLGADYLWGLKGNQSGILEQAQKRLPKDFFSL